MVNRPGTLTQRLFDNIGTVLPILRLVSIIISRNIIHANLHNSNLLFLAEFLIFLYGEPKSPLIGDGHLLQAIDARTMVLVLQKAPSSPPTPFSLFPEVK
jgi:hypothetical protein